MSNKHKVKIPKGYEFISNEVCADGDGWEPKLYRKKKELPKTWEKYKYDRYYTRETKSVSIVMPSKNMDAFCALSQLVELRDHYNDRWEPDWTDDGGKNVISINSNLISKAYLANVSHVLAFKTHELRNEFLSNFRELIETAKPLL